MGHNAARKVGNDPAKRQLPWESAGQGDSLTWSVASSNKFLDLPLQDGLSSTFVEAVNGELLSLLREIGASLDGEPDMERLREIRTLLVKAAHSIMMQSELLSELHQLALTDELTGFYNRRGFLVLGMQQLKMSRRQDEPLLLFFVDVDHLKLANDSYGHDEGDALLLRCAAVLKNTFRESDIVARLGGDEFAVLAAEGADRSCEVILRRMEEHIREVNTRGGLTTLSLSTGVSRFDPHAPVSLAELLTQADRNMYQNKRSRDTWPADEPTATKTNKWKVQAHGSAEWKD